MARAYSIYVVKDLKGRERAAFTVKHELVRWLEEAEKAKGPLQVIRLIDNQPLTIPHIMTREELGLTYD